ncbi:PD40 domain-containing protein [bacterium]|nr:PD40 domain-containing protein [bacterium]
MLHPILRLIAAALWASAALSFRSGCAAPPPGKGAAEQAVVLDRMPHIDPDYSDTVIPPNIAPLNFRVREEADEYTLAIQSRNGDPIRLKNKSGSFRIPRKAWKKMLSGNAGESLSMLIQVKKNGRWREFKPVVNRIALEPIDRCLAYRLINPAFSLWTVMGLYQRNLENFEEKPILVNRLTQDNCMNCHNFKGNDPEFMLMHLRGGKGSGTLIRSGGKLHKVNTATDFNRAGAYPSWHPDGNIIAFSANSLTMFFHATGESRDVLDSGSDLVLYLLNENRITSGPGIADPKRMETFPCWAPDGRHLYFCAADELNSWVGMRDGREDLFWEKIRYDLMRIAYDAEKDAWGEPETVLSAKEAGGSITIPRVSPDGRRLIFTLADYGNFPIYLKSADLYLMDLETGKYKRMECNSGNTDSFHSWSSNSRWIVFSSKRMDGLCARPYFSYLDAGVASKPFPLPQEDPAFYDTFLKTYNVPELAKEMVPIGQRAWADTAIKKPALKAQLDTRLKKGESRSDEHEAESPDLYQKAKR